MRYLAKTILILFILIVVVVGFIQSPWGKRLALHLLTRSLHQSGLSIQVGAVEGSLPQKVMLHDLDIKGADWELKAKSLYLELSIIRLFKKEISIKQLKGDGIAWSAEMAIEKKGKKSSLPYTISIRHFYLTNVLFSDETHGSLEGSIRIGRSGKTQLNLHTQIENLAYGPIEMRCELKGSLPGPFYGEMNGTVSALTYAGAFTYSNSGSAHFDGQIGNIPHMAPLSVQMDFTPDEEKNLEMKAQYQTAQWTFDSFPIENIGGKIEAIWREKSLSGFLSSQGELYKESWSGKADFIWTPKKNFELSGWNLQGPTLSSNGNLLIRSDGMVEGQSSLQIERLQALKLPSLPLFGSVEANLIWKIEEGRQIQSIKAKANQVFLGPLFAEKLVLDSELKDPFHSPRGSIQIDVSQGKWKELDINSATITTSKSEENWPFHITLGGKWKHPVELKLDGLGQLEQNGWTIRLEKATGSFYNHPFVLASAITMQKSLDLFQISDAQIRLGDGTASLSFSHEKEQTEGKIAIRHLPIDILSLNPLDISLGGTFDLDANLLQKEDAIQGNLEAKITNLTVITMEEESPIYTSGNFSANLNRDRLDIQGSLDSVLQLSLSLPLKCEIWPLNYELLQQSEVEGSFVFQGNVEDIFDFFDLGTHHFEGVADCHFHLSHTLAHPHLTGSCIWKNGSYQNYYTGTQLQNVQAEWICDNSSLILRSLTAEDYQNKGHFGAKGKIALIPEQSFPFDFELSFDHLNCVEIDLVSAEANGEVILSGNLHEAWAKGTISISQSLLTIPDHIPRPIPKLQVTYRNPIRPIVPNIKPSFNPYPLHLDLNVSAPEAIFITGRGLNSEWKGDFAIGGTIDSPSAKGKLELIKGDFTFASRRFKLSDGALSLSGKEREMPHLNIAASVEEKGVLVIARLKGALNKPQLTFQSVPPLPMSSILAILLFGEDLSEINGVQALQLANAIASIAGEGPDILENTRRSIGVDRLRIITVPSGAEEGEDAIALQVGKYIAQGVIISVSQGAEDNSSNISIEVELKYGFSLQAETQQQQEQGKFTIKWNLNY